MFGIDDIFLLAVPEMFAAAEGAAAITTAAEVAAAAEAAATAAAAAEAAAAATTAAEAATAAQTATGIMQAAPAAETAALQASPELMQSVANFTPETNMFSPQSTQLAGPLPSSSITQPIDAPLNSLAQVQAAPSNMAPGYESLGTQPGGPYSTANLSNANNIASESLGTQPGGPYDTSNLSNANDVPNTRLDAWQAKYDAPGGTDSSFMKGFNAVSDWAEKNPFKAAGLGYMAYSALNKPEPYKSTPYDGPLSKFRISPDFQGRQANPQDFQYTPRQYASGGITDIQSYAKGKLTEDNVDVGIYRDTDPDTANLDPLTAAMLRQSKLDKRSYVNTKAKFNKPTPMGTLNFKPVVGAAQGGIMGASNLGGYAAGGNPRLLRGPGDGMSDNIPATINNRQPARLADGEFVVPADVVSHLGNGSTEAGAKKLHEMMNKVRKARTGNPKQGKQINPNKYIPK
jgi:hypothetical protein